MSSIPKAIFFFSFGVWCWCPVVRDVRQADDGPEAAVLRDMLLERDQEIERLKVSASRLFPDMSLLTVPFGTEMFPDLNCAPWIGLAKR